MDAYQRQILALQSAPNLQPHVAELREQLTAVEQQARREVACAQQERATAHRLVAEDQQVSSSESAAQQLRLESQASVLRHESVVAALRIQLAGQEETQSMASEV